MQKPIVLRVGASTGCSSHQPKYWYGTLNGNVSSALSWRGKYLQCYVSCLPSCKNLWNNVNAEDCISFLPSSHLTSLLKEAIWLDKMSWLLADARQLPWRQSLTLPTDSLYWNNTNALTCCVLLGVFTRCIYYKRSTAMVSLLIHVQQPCTPQKHLKNALLSFQPPLIKSCLVRLALKQTHEKILTGKGKLICPWLLVQQCWNLSYPRLRSSIAVLL